MNELKKKIYDINLYKNTLEGVYKITFWIISWIVGIAVMMGTSDKRTLGSAFLIFSFSLLIEFAPQIDQKITLTGTLVHGTFCLILILILLFSLATLTYHSDSDEIIILNGFGIAMFCLSIVVNIFMFLNLLSIVVFAGLKSNKASEIENSEPKPENLKLFEKKLTNGALGNLSKGDKHYE